MAPQEVLVALRAADEALRSSVSELNRLDGHAGDGDMGLTMAEAAQAIEELIDTGGPFEVPELLSSCGAALAKRAPSTSGTLLATGFLRAAKALRAQPDSQISPVEYLHVAFVAALEGISARGKASVGDRTMVDGLDAICTSLASSVSSGVDVPAALAEAAHAAEAAAAATENMAPKAGRASWAPDRALGHRDAGCAMLAIVMAAVASALAPPGA